jgi:hypothetical protein
MINKYVIYVLDQWAASNSEDYALWEGIQMEFSSWTQDRLNQISSPTCNDWSRMEQQAV